VEPFHFGADIVIGFTQKHSCINAFSRHEFALAKFCNKLQSEIIASQ